MFLNDEEKVTEAIAERSEGLGETENTEQDVKTTEAESTEEASTSEETTEKVEGEESSEETTEETGEGKTEEKSELDELLEPKEEKSNVQKRIDRLVAESHQKDERIKALEAKADGTEKKDKVYSEEQLLNAEAKVDQHATSGEYAEAVRLQRDIDKERRRNDKRDIIDMYQAEQNKKTQATTAGTQEWKDIQERYSSDDPEMDIRSTASKLFRVAKAYFADPELSKIYSKPGGQLLAVADAFRDLIEISKKKKKKSPGEKTLERKLGKIKAKTQLGAGGVEKAKSTSKTKTGSDKFNDYINEREAAKAKAVESLGKRT